MYASMLLSILLAGAPDVAPPPNCDDAHAWSDFDRVHEELGLVGSAPLYGMEIERPTGAAFKTPNAPTIVPSGAAPLFGLEELPPLKSHAALTVDPIR